MLPVVLNRDSKRLKTEYSAEQIQKEILSYSSELNQFEDKLKAVKDYLQNLEKENAPENQAVQMPPPKKVNNSTTPQSTVPLDTEASKGFPSVDSSNPADFSPDSERMFSKENFKYSKFEIPRKVSLPLVVAVATASQEAWKTFVKKWEEQEMFAWCLAYSVPINMETKAVRLLTYNVTMQRQLKKNLLPFYPKCAK
jgi:hypothetical protein